MLIGFSTGALHRTHTTKQALQEMKRVGCNAVELGFVKKIRVEDGWMDELTADNLAGFDYVSLHAPKMEYGDNAETRSMFDKIQRVNALRPLDVVVFHPDNVKEISVFKGLHFPVGFENMDNQKPFGTTVDELRTLLETDPSFRFILDLNHIKTLDPTMRLARDFHAAFGDRLIEYHISGLGDNYPHVPLVTANQRDILEAIEDSAKPLIDEAVTDVNMLSKEKEFIERVINNRVVLPPR